MEFHRITNVNETLFGHSYELYRASFPLHEQRPPHHQGAVLANPAYHFETVVEDREPVGLIGYWLTEAFAYIEHFAINPQWRGRSLGSLALKEFCRSHPLVILEIDPPEDAVSVRREKFYLRLGFQSNDYPHLHPAYRKTRAPYRLMVMTYPRKISASEYGDFSRYIAEVVMEEVEK